MNCTCTVMELKILFEIIFWSTECNPCLSVSLVYSLHVVTSGRSISQRRIKQHTTAEFYTALYDPCMVPCAFKFKSLTKHKHHTDKNWPNIEDLLYHFLDINLLLFQSQLFQKCQKGKNKWNMERVIRHNIHKISQSILVQLPPKPSTGYNGMSECY